MSLGVTVNEAKNGMLLAYIANRIPGIHLRKLLKIVYLLDERFVIQRGFPLTWFDYYAWAKGPVAPEVYEVKNGAFSDYVHAERDAEGKWIVSSNERSGYVIFSQLGEFSQAEITEIDRLLDECEGKSADELSDLTHEPDSLWSAVVRENDIRFTEDYTRTDFEIKLENLFADDDCRREVYEDARWDTEFQGMLNNSRASRDV